jgi:hypothetical protein
MLQIYPNFHENFENVFKSKILQRTKKVINILQTALTIHVHYQMGNITKWVEI